MDLETAARIGRQSRRRLRFVTDEAGTRLRVGWIAAAADRLSGAGWLSRCVIAAGAGVLAALAMAPYHVIPLFFVAFTVLVWLIDGLGRTERRLVSAAWIGWSFGLGFFGLGLHWIGHAFLVDAETFAGLMPIAMIGLNAGLALFPAVAIILARLFWHSAPSRILVLALAWTMTEWLRGHVLTGFPWLLAGYLWGDALPILQAASLVGIYGLSLLTVLIAASPAVLADFSGGRAEPARPGATIWLGVTALILAALVGFGFWRLSAPPAPTVPSVRLRIVQPSVPQALKLGTAHAADIFRLHMQLTARPGLDTITHIVWTEAAVPTRLAEEPNALAEMAALAPGRTYLAGSTRYEPGPGIGRFYNSLFEIAGGAVTAAYDKHHLVPFGEYLPLPWLLSRIGFRQLVESEGGGFTPGPDARTLAVPGAPDVGALICYEAIFPGAVVDPRRRPGWLLNVTDDTWFGHGFGPRQHFEIARVRAIEEGLPLVRAANNGISAVIDGRGRVLAQLPFDAVDILDSPLPRPEPPTLYGGLYDVTYITLWTFLSGVAYVGSRKLRNRARL